MIYFFQQKGLYSVAVITPDFDSGNPGSIPGTTYFLLTFVSNNNSFN